MIKVDELTHAYRRIRRRACERVAHPSGAEAVAQQTRAYLGEHFGFDPTSQVRAELDAEHAAIMSDLAVQFAARRGTRRASA